MATRILAHLGLLAPDGRVAMCVGRDVVYLAGRSASAATMTPYDVAAVRLADGLALAGSAPDELEAYLSPLRADVSTRVVARARSGEIVGALDAAELVERLAQRSWSEAENVVRAAGGLVGAYPVSGEG